MSSANQDAAYPALGNLQGMVAYRYEQPFYAVLLLGINDASRVPGFLSTWLPRVPRGDADPKRLTGPVLNFAFTWAGLARLLELDPELGSLDGTSAFDFAFTEQTPDRRAVAAQLGFIGPSAPDRWWDGNFVNPAIGLAVYAAFDSEAQRAETLAALRASAAVSGLRELPIASFPDGALGGHRPEGGILHFGYRDGVTAPDIDWKDERLPGKVDFREFVMGYPSEAYAVTPLAGPWRDFARDGSFACLAWIHQDVAAFNRFIATNHHHASGEAEAGWEKQWLAAKLLGRWPDGSALLRHPRRPPDAPDFADDFGFAQDPDGKLCPLTAHIRVVNARDDELTYPNRRRFPAGPPRFIRRGFTYGATLHGTEDDGAPRGIIGTFLCARVNEQFYTVLRWMQKTEFAEGYYKKPYRHVMQDALFGNRRAAGAKTTFPIPREGGEAERVELADFITYRGVSVFLLPSMSSLERLSLLPAGRQAAGL